MRQGWTRGGGPMVGVVCSGSILVGSGNSFAFGLPGASGASFGNYGETGLQAPTEGCF